MRGEIDLWMYVTTDALYHHGIKGQRWGVRRFQNRDGSLTSKGRVRYDTGPGDHTNRQEQPRKSRITKKHVAIGAAVVGGTVLAAYGATKYRKLVNARTVADAASAYSKVASGVSKAAVSQATATKASTAASTVAKTASTVTSTAKKAASTAKSASKPILTLSGNDAGFSQADMDRMLDNLGKMADIARSGQDIVRNL